MEGVILDIETGISPDIGKRLGIAEKLAEVRGEEDPDVLHRIAKREEIACGNMKDPAKIAAKIEAAMQAKIEKAALNCWGAQITTIGLASTHGAREDLKAYREQGRWSGRGHCKDIGVSEWDEPSLIAWAIEKIEWEFDNPIVIGFNIRGAASWSTGFDIKVLRTRAAMLGVRWPHWMPGNVREDRNSRRLFDICDVFPEGTLNDILLANDLPPKTASGSEVSKMTPQERVKYCAHDVSLERMLFAICADLSSVTSSLIE